MSLPEKRTYVEQVADHLRRQILSGTWQTVLPSERELAGHLQAARNTIRSAIQLLADEGLIHVQDGRRRHYICRPDPSTKAPTAPRLSRAILLTNAPISALTSHTLLRLDLIRGMLSGSGIDLHVLSSRAFKMERPAVTLQELTDAHPNSLWILHHSTEPMQRWFLSQKIPCLTWGSAFPGISLPGLAFDLAASMRHCMGVLKAQGHTSVAFVEPRHLLAGQRAARGVMEEPSHRWARVRSLVWDGNYALFPKTVNKLMQQPRPPTAFIVTQCRHILVLYSTFCHLGIQVPGDVSSVALFDDPQMSHIVPPLSCYRENAEMESRRMATLIRQAMRGFFPQRFTTLLQEYAPGHSIARPRPP